MPNVAPNGLFARRGGAWRNPGSIYARVEQTWKRVDFVYARQNGQWRLIWGSGPVAPAAAVAAWAAPNMVKVTVTPPPINTNTHWVLRRSDGSIAATAPVSSPTVDDLTPLLSTSASGDKVLAAYTVEGTDGVAVSARVSTNTVTWNLDPDTVTTEVTYPSATAATVTVGWTPNATYGPPDGWRVWRSDGVWVSDVLPASTASYAALLQPRGTALGYRAVPMALRADGTYTQAGNSVNAVANSKATTPVSVTLVATSTPVANLRLTWASGGGTVTGYEVETSTNGTAWAAHTDVTSPSDWSTTVAGYMRVRAVSAGGPSDWVQAGPVTPILDNTGPVASVITSFKPESSYGRMVVRGTWSSSSDTKTGQIFYRVGSGSYVSVWSGAVTPSAVFGVVTNTASAGQTVTVLVRTWDATGNQGTDRTATYTLVASPIIVNPSGDLSGTYRGSAWRNDGVRSTTEIATGWSSSGHNIGCYFYGTAVAAAIAAKTIASATIEYWREDEGGWSTPVQPLFWTHALTGRTAAPALNAHGVAEASRLGSGVTRTGSTSGGSFTLPAAFIAALQAGSARGLAMYRGYQGSGDPDTYYALMSIGGVTGGNPSKVNGRLRFNHLG